MQERIYSLYRSYQRIRKAIDKIEDKFIYTHATCKSDFGNRRNIELQKMIKFLEILKQHFVDVNESDTPTTNSICIL